MKPNQQLNSDDMTDNTENALALVDKSEGGHLHEEKNGMISAIKNEAAQLINSTNPHQNQPLNVCEVRCSESLNILKKTNRPVTLA
jgi:hypothetical protein